MDDVISLSAEGSRFAADYGSVTGTSPEAREQAQHLAETWRRHGLDLDVASLAYPGEHTDVAAHLQGRGWDVTRFSLADLFIGAGLPALRTTFEDEVPAATIGFVTAVLK